MNFGLRNWIEEGKKHQTCTCRADSIENALRLMLDETEQELIGQLELACSIHGVEQLAIMVLAVLTL